MLSHWRRLFKGVVAAAVVTALGPIASPVVGLPASPALAASCPKVEAYDLVAPQSSADGSSASWTLRTLSAVDWSSGGFASQVMWTSTNYKTPDQEWVEVGVTQGWEGSNAYTYYTAHGDYTVSPQVYAEARWTSPLPVVGGSQTFTVVSTSTSGVGTYTAYVGSAAYSWNHHQPNTSYYAVGLESTCQDSRVDRTYVSTHSFRNRTTKYYTLPNSGTIKEVPAGPQGIAWCNSPVQFRFYLNSVLSTGSCS